MKISKHEPKAHVLITGDELLELKKRSYQMIEAFGLDSRIGRYQGKRPIWLHSWDFDCLFAVIALALQEQTECPEASSPSYFALKRLNERLRTIYQESFPDRRRNLLSRNRT